MAPPPQPARPPGRVALDGRFAQVAPLDADAHGASLWAALQGHDALWDHMAYGPFADEAAFRAWLGPRAALDDPLPFAVLDRVTRRARGLAALMSIRPEMGVIEIGHLVFSPALQRTPAATEAIHLLARHAFDDLGYRRLEWKCDSRNEASKRAALRFGFTPEGVFRQHMIVKGRNRDTAWFAMLDTEWPARRAAFARWLAPDNFDAEGRQRARLAEVGGTGAARVGRQV